MATKKKQAKAGTAQKTDGVVKVALLGFGTVGSSVAKVLAEQKFAGIALTHVYNRSVARKKESAAAKYVPATAVWTENIDDVLKSNVDVVIELMGGLNPVEGWLKKALAAGKHVVTANKQLIAYRGVSAAEAGGAAWRAAGLWCGGCGRSAGDSGDSSRGWAATGLLRISGIVNGTCNYILSRMETGADYATVLKDAQQLGYAEANPSADVDGFDARAKLCILSRIALHAELNPDEVATQTISTVEAIDFAYAKELNCTIRQVSRAQLNGGAGACACGADAGSADVADGVVAWDAEHGGHERRVTAATLSSQATARAASLRRWRWCRTFWRWRRERRRWSCRYGSGR